MEDSYFEGVLHGNVLTTIDTFHTEKYDFEYMDERYLDDVQILELKLEYTGSKVEWKVPEDFETREEYHEHVIEAGGVIANKGIELFEKLQKFIEENRINLVLDNYEFDDDDYFVIYFEFKLKYRI